MLSNAMAILTTMCTMQGLARPALYHAAVPCAASCLRQGRGEREKRKRKKGRREGRNRKTRRGNTERRRKTAKKKLSK